MPSKPQRYKPTRSKPPEARPNSAARGYGHRWREASKQYLDQHPLCVRCQAKGKLTGATVVDHVTPHKGDRGLFWDEGNWQSLCKWHHDSKTATEDGGLGRGRGPGPAAG